MPIRVKILSLGLGKKILSKNSINVNLVTAATAKYIFSPTNKSCLAREISSPSLINHSQNYLEELAEGRCRHVP